MKIHQAFAPIAMAFGLSACGGPVDVDTTEAVCKADVEGISNSDPMQRFKIVNPQTNQPLYFSSPSHVYTRGHENLLSKAVDAVFQPKLEVRYISTAAVIQKTDEFDVQIGWEVAPDIDFKIELDNNGDIAKCAVLNGDGEGQIFYPKPPESPAP